MIRMIHFAVKAALIGMVSVAFLNQLLADPPADSASAVVALKKYLSDSPEKRPPIATRGFARLPLNKKDATLATKLLQEDHHQRIRKERAAEMKARSLSIDNVVMPFFYKVFGEKPKQGRNLFISMHGGGGAPKQVNDQQWNNQKQLYALEEGVYLVPRAPANTWNLWHQGHIDPLFNRLIENLIVFEDVNPDRVYLMGYSAGGDGVYQLAPRMADSLAAASMMAGHPNETSPLGLRNLPFSIHVGGDDGAYNRNKVAGQWKQKLEDLAKADPKGYVHWAKIYQGKGHWLNREDAAAIPWMAKFDRIRFPERVVWKQDDVTHGRFYWLAVADDQRKARSEVVAERDGQHFKIQRCQVNSLKLRFCDEFVDLDQPIVITFGGKQQFKGVVQRSIAVLAETLAERGDPRMMFSAEVTVDTAVEMPSTD